MKGQVIGQVRFISISEAPRKTMSDKTLKLIIIGLCAFALCLLYYSR